MTLAAYQHVFCRMVASSAYRERLLTDPRSVLDQHPLREREQRRLLALAAHPGMRVNTAIHRANRLTPLDQTLPLTCLLLGERLAPLLARYWQSHPTENLQLPAECARFADFLTAELRYGRLADPFVEEVLSFERACTELRFLSAHELADKRGAASALPAQVRIVRFRHDPERLLAALAEQQPPPADLTVGDFLLLIDARAGEPVFRLLDEQGVVALASWQQAEQATRSALAV